MANNPGRRRIPADYKIACICPMGVELAPVEGMLDEIHDPLPTKRDQNAYTLGAIGGHNIVIAVMPEIGNNAAAVTVTQLLNDFPTVQFGLLVGIGGGVPGDVDVRLGDLVIGQPTGGHPGVVQYDMGKELEGRQFQRTGALNKPPASLSANVRKLDGQHRRLGHSLSLHIAGMLERYPKMQTEYSRPPAETRDQLFLTTYTHQSGSTCDQCDDQFTVSRPARLDNEPRIHYGTIGSANKVIKNATIRDQIGQDTHALCIEMEAAGLMSDFPCLVIRGICDYADSHKNKNWQPYAAAVAAAYMKALLLVIPAQDDPLVDCISKNTSSPSRIGLTLTEAPVIEDHLFIGRLAELNEMERVLQPQSSSQKHRRLVLGGLGGIGKTQLAIAYAKQHSNRYDSVFWLNAASETVLGNSFRLMARRIMDVEQHQELDDSQLVLHVTRWLVETENTQWLLIFDNYDEPNAYDIGRYCPYGSHGSVIITTRLPDQVQGQQLLVESLDDIEQSLDILATRSKRAYAKSDSCARILAARMQGLPLALATAGTFLCKSTWTFERYLQEYEEQWNISPRRPLQLQEYRDRTLYTTWDLSYQRLEKENADSARLLKVLAYFDNQQIWFELLHGGINDEIPYWLAAILHDSVSFECTMRVLVDYSFATTQLITQSYTIHTCVHDWVLVGLNSNVNACYYWYAFNCTAMPIISVSRDTLAYIQYAKLAPHARRLMHARFSAVRNRITFDRLSQASNIAQLLLEQYQSKNATMLQQLVLDGYERALGTMGILTLDAVAILARFYHRSNSLIKSEQMYLRALTGNEKALGVDHKSTLDMVHNLGVLYRDQGKLVEAEQMYLRALNGYEKALVPDHLSIYQTMSNLGVFYTEQGRLMEAEQFHLRALAGRDEALGSDHVLTLNTVKNLGDLYCTQGKLAEAEPMYLRALAGNEKAFGVDHKSTLVVVHNLGNLYANQGKLAAATQMHCRVFNGSETANGPSDKFIMATLNSLVWLYYKQGKLSEAERMYRRLVSADVDDEADRTAGIQYLAFVISEKVRLQADNPTAVRKSLAELIQHMQQCMTSNTLVINRLARAFVLANQDEDASMAYFHSIKVSINPADWSGVLCDGCDKQITMKEGRWICRQCIDTDLCNSCMARCVAGDQPIATCHGHEYCDGVELLKRAFNMPESSSKKDWSLWLAELRKKYQVQGV